MIMKKNSTMNVPRAKEQSGRQKATFKRYAGTMEHMRNDYEEKLDNQRASHEAAKRDSESNIQALRDTMERLRNDYEEKLDAERAAHDNSRREAESNVKALRETMDAVRSDYENNFGVKNNEK